MLKTKNLANLLAMCFTLTMNIVNAQCPLPGATTHSRSITSAETWTSPSSGPWYQILVKQHGKLTITTGVELQFITTGKIVVEPGGQLILEACTLKKYGSCPYWQGIEVMGENTPVGNQYADFDNRIVHVGPGSPVGNCKLMGSLILDASPAGVYSENGGVINAENATFKNCLNGVWVNNYLKHENKHEYENACRFVDCNFILQSTINGTNDFNGYTGLFLRNVTGVVVESCNFECTYAGNLENRGTGIDAENSSVWVTKTLSRASNTSGKGIIDLEDLEKKCPIYLTSNVTTIKHFTDGLTFGGARNKAVGLNHVEVIGCKQGVYLRGGTKHVIDTIKIETKIGQYKFSNASYPMDANYPQFLIKIDTSTNSLIYRTDFISDFDIPYLVLEKNGNMEMELSKCRLTNLNSSRTGKGIEIIENNSGFFFRCNKFVHLDYDLYINSNGKIKTNQYKNTHANGNVHSTSALENLYNNNAGHNPIYYYYKGTPPSIGGLGSGLINRIFKGTVSCPNYTCNIHPVSTKDQINNELSVFPNPSTGELHIITDLMETSPLFIYVFDIQGKLVYKQLLVNSTIQLYALIPGLYYLQIINGEGDYVHTQKLLIETAQ